MASAKKSSKNIKRTTITAGEYAKKIDALIEKSKDKSVVETLMLLLDEANKYNIGDSK